MDQTYFTTAAMLPTSKRGALLPRPQGDGMDSETLKIRDLAPSSVNFRTSPPRSRENLASSPKTATVSKTEKPHFIPHEPVRGAVKPLTPVGTQHMPNRREMSPKAEKSTLNAPQVSPQGNRANASILYATYNGPYGQPAQSLQQNYANPMGGPLGTGTVKTINVPVYNAPGHLSHNTYKLMAKQQKLSRSSPEPPKEPIKPTLKNETISINMTHSGKDSLSHQMASTDNPPSHQLDTSPSHQGSVQVALSMEEVIQTSRQVEGDNRTVTMSDLEKLNDEINELRRELENQTKVNTDLKKLLVASMGDDLQYKMDRLVQDKVQLTEEVGNYTKRLHQDYEDIDKLSIQADMWRSKFKASRVMTDQLTQKNQVLTQNYQNAHSALQRLLQERQQMKEWMSQTHRFLFHVRTAFEPKHAPIPQRSGPQTLLSLAQANLQLSDNVKFRLLGPMASSEDGVDAGTVDALSPAEAYAFQVLSTPVPTSCSASTTRPIAAPLAPTVMPYSVKGMHERFHPSANHDNLTLNICNKCKGEIQLV